MFLYKLQKLNYDRIDVPEENDINKIIPSKERDICH